jgi:hypothetical protein
MTPQREAYLANLWKHDLEWSEQRIIETGEIAMMAIVCTPGGNAVIEPRGLGLLDREVVLAAFRCFCVANAAFSITVMSEAWMRIGLQISDGVMPSKSPDRIEMLTLVNTYRDDETGKIAHRISTRPILRGAGGYVIGLGPDTIPAGVTAAGDMAELLPLRTPTFTDVRKAREALWRIRSMFKPFHAPGHA